VLSQPCHIELLGGLRLLQGGRVMTRFRTQKTAALLAYLAYYSERSHPREMLIELLWPEVDPKAGRDSLNMALSSLRRQLEPPGVPAGAVLRGDRFFVQMDPNSITTDVAMFEAALQKAEAADSIGERTRHLADAIALYRSQLLPGYYEEWILPEQERLAALFFRAAHRLTMLLQEAGESDRALDYARRAVRIDPLREEAREDLMRLLAAMGQPAAALHQYRELALLLKEQLGVSPCFAIRHLAVEIEQAPQRPHPGEATAAARAASAPAPASSHAADHDLVETPLLPGTLTFLRLEFEVSSPVSALPEALRTALADGMARISRTCLHHGGREMRVTDTALLVAFARASDALAAAVQGQRALAQRDTGQGLSALRARMALDTQEVKLKEGRTQKAVLKPVSQLLLAAHEGQILCTEQTAILLRRDPAPHVRLTDLGSYRLPDLPAPERLFQVEYPDRQPETFPPPRAAPAYRTELPLAVTRFWGREAELMHLQSLLSPEPPLHPREPGAPEGSDGASAARLVTLTGPGGIGKTRLALETVRRLQQQHNLAVWFVPLENVTDPPQLVETIRDALHLPRAPRDEVLEQIVAALSQQPTLLILDNFEQVAEAGAPIVSRLLERVPTLSCLVTSRQALELAAEQEFPVAPLPTPSDAAAPERLLEFAGIQMFVDRAQARRPDFQITANNAMAITSLCHRLEGIPLAIELAAAWVRTLTPAQMLSRLSRRFDLLVSGRRDLPARHSSLRAALEGSYRLLKPAQQRLFARLSVFRGGWTLEAAEAVCEAGAPEGVEPDPGDALFSLQQLQNCSLIYAEEVGEALRFGMLETLREFASEQLSSEEVARRMRRHTDHYLALAQESMQQTGAEQTRGMERLETEHDNLRTALRWCLEEGENREEGRGKREENNSDSPSPAERSEGSQGEGSDSVSPSPREGEGAGGEGHPLSSLFPLPSSLGIGSEGPFSIGNRKPVLSEANGSEIAEVGLELALALSRFWEIRGHMREAQRWLETALAANPDAVPDLRAKALGAIALHAIRQGEYKTARRYSEQSLALYRQEGDTYGIARMLNNLGMIAREQSDYATARSLYGQSLALLRELKNDWGVSAALNNLAGVAYVQGDYPAARTLYEQALELLRQVGNRAGVGMALANLGLIAHAEGDLEAARSFHEESLAVGQELGYKHNISIALHNLGDVMRDLGDYARAQALLEECLALKQELGDRQGYASTLCDLGSVAARRKDYPSAEALWRESLQLRRETGDKEGIASCLESFAQAAAAQERLLRSGILYAAAAALRAAVHVPLPTFIQREQQQRLAELRASLGEALFSEVSERGSRLTLEQATDFALSEADDV
jgi:predicted ATPase/DNA-binding SARP family transcriptional activator